MEKITIGNPSEVRNVLNRARVKTKYHGDAVIFTNGNSWYVDTLIRNLLISVNRNEEEEYKKVVVFCSDREGHQKCAELGYPLYEYVDIPYLCVQKITENSEQKEDFYTRLTFVKIVLMSFILEMKLTPIYLDPDMAFRNKSIDDILSYLRYPHEFVCSGTPSYMNSNIMVAKPGNFCSDIFDLRTGHVEAILKDPRMYSDEDFLEPRLGKKTAYIDQKKYPPGSDALKYLSVANIIHANCVKGLENKVLLLKKCGAWNL